MRVDHVDNSTEDIAQWLTTQIAGYVHVSPAHLQPGLPLAEYGLDSVSAVGLCGDIEIRFDIPVEPTMVFDYPTIDSIAGFVARQATPAMAGR